MLEGKKKIIFIFVFLAIIAAAGGVFWFSGGYQDWQENRAEKALVNKAEEVQRRIEEAYRNDTYGGKTPQETLDMFVVALRAGDIELASKYFALDDNLERAEWYNFLLKIKNDKSLDQMATDISTATLYKSVYEGNQQFIIFNKNKTDSLIINMIINPISKIWKIESL
ncbi:MAG: hypothetical protein AAB772_02480 [Patescibacteria group bacterium]